MAEDKDKKSKKLEPPRLFRQRTTNTDVTFVESQQIGLDVGISGGRGIPLGDFITVWAPPGSGKTTIIGDAIRRIIARHKRMGIPFKAMYIDIEGSKDLLLSMGLGEYIESGDLIYTYGETVTYADLAETYDSILQGEENMKDVRLIVVDSITSVTTEDREARGVEDADYGIIAKAAKAFYRKYVPKCKEKLTTFMINQVACNQDATNPHSPKIKNASGEAAKHYSSIIAFLAKKTSKQDKDTKEVDVQTTFGVKKRQPKFIVTLKTVNESYKLKNRFGDIPDVDILVDRGVGAVNAFTLREMLAGQGFITGSGYYSLSKELPVEVPDKKLPLKELNKFISANTR